MAVKKRKCPASKHSASREGEGKRIMNVFYCTPILRLLYDGIQAFEYPQRGPSYVELAHWHFPEQLNQAIPL